MTADAQSLSVRRLAEGFSALLEEYNSLLRRNATLERCATDTKAQVERFVVERGTVSKKDLDDLQLRQGMMDIEDPDRRQIRNEKWWMRSDLPMSRKSLLRTRYAVDSLPALGLENAADGDAYSKISSEAIQNGSSAMPSISESPMELDFTIPGTPSRLDCPFASMSNRRLSAHAASVMSRYRPGSATPRSAASRIIGTVHAPAAAAGKFNGSGPHEADMQLAAKGSDAVNKAKSDLEASIQGSGPQCPIRFLEKNSPEEVAQYFEKHKHELPRSHEVCVKRYQGDEQSVRQLDAKYGNLVSMIQGLGQKHVPMLPTKQDSHGQEDEEAERVRAWASHVNDQNESAEAAVVDAEDEERLPHFDRPLKDVRVGESPSRPWGVPVPLSAQEQVEHEARQEAILKNAEQAAPSKPVTGCPFAGRAPPGMVNPHMADGSVLEGVDAGKVKGPELPPEPATSKGAEQSLPAPVFINGGNGGGLTSRAKPGDMTFSGPVFIGYSPDQAAAVIKALQQGRSL